MITPNNKHAVEKFSENISPQTMAVGIMIYLKAFGCASSSRCMEERMRAV
jgi:hypothetical protein